MTNTTNKKSNYLVSKLNVIDDIFFHKMVEDIEVCQEILRILLEDNNLEVTENHPQDSLKNLQGKSVILDARCRDSNGRYYNVEVQKADNDDHQRRVRYNGSLNTSAATKTGTDYFNVPDVTIIFISAFDLFTEKRTIYHVERCLKETGTFVDNGFHEIYVNTRVNDGSDIAELMQFFKNSTGYHDNFPRLSDRVRLFKETEEGVTYMSSVIDDYFNSMKEKVSQQARQEGRQAGIREGRQAGIREGNFLSVRQLMLNHAAQTEEEACRMLSVDYNAYREWIKQQD